MFETRRSLYDVGPMAGRYPPQHHRRPFKLLEPIGAAAIELLMDRFPDKALKRLDAFPNGKIDDDKRVGIRPRVGGVTALVDVTPDETGAPFGDAVHQRKIVGETGHARIVDLIPNAADVQLRKLMIGRLLQGPAPLATSVILCEPGLSRTSGIVTRTLPVSERWLSGLSADLGTDMCSANSRVR